MSYPAYGGDTSVADESTFYSPYRVSGRSAALNNSSAMNSDGPLRSTSGYTSSRPHSESVSVNASNASLLDIEGGKAVRSPNSLKSPTRTNSRRRRRDRPCCCACCIPRTTRGKIALVSGLVLFLVALALILYFFIPRSPGITFHTVQIDNSQGSIYNIVLPSDTSSDFAVWANADLNITVKNPNYYGLKVNRMDIDLYVLGNTTTGGETQTVARYFGGGEFTNTWFPRRNSLPISIPLTVGFNFTKGYSAAATDASLAAFLSACGYTITGEQTTRGTFQVKYKATAYVRGLKIVHPKFESIVNVGCPFSEAQTADIVAEISGMFDTSTTDDTS